MSQKKKARVFIGIGSNIGDRLSYCQKAVAALCHHPEIQLTKISSLYETVPVDYLAQDCFYNAVVAIETSLSPLKLLDCCQEIEKKLDKKIDIPKGPRTLDLDLIFYGDHISTSPDLILPHPEIARRLFVLIPLAEIAADFTHPKEGCTIQTILTRFQSDQFKAVKKCFEPGWEKKATLRETS